MQLIAYLATLGLEGVLEEAFDSQMPATQTTSLDQSDPSEAILIRAREANAKVVPFCAGTEFQETKFGECHCHE